MTDPKHVVIAGDWHGEKVLERACPRCTATITYTLPCSLRRAERKDVVCRRCVGEEQSLPPARLLPGGLQDGVPYVRVPLAGGRADGRVTLVDEADADLVRASRWHLWEMERAGRRQTGPYAYAKVDGRSVRMHSLLTGWPMVDHRNLNGLDNRRINLRPATFEQNNRNQRSAITSSSQYKGVFWYKRGSKWAAQIKVDGKSQHLGYFTTEIDAARAYDAAALPLWGEYARLNFGEAA